MKKAILIGTIAVAGGLAYFMRPARNVDAVVVTQTTLAEVLVPDEFSPNAQIGQVGFAQKCASCHGENAAGRDGMAPPLVHVIYEPNHHGDESF